MNLLPFVMIIILVLGLFSLSQFQSSLSLEKTKDAYVAYFKGKREVRNQREALAYEENIKESKWVEEGYQGKITILREFLQPIRGKEQKPIQRYETDPGEQMQVDWVVLRRGANPLSAFIGVLGHSRKAYAEFTRNEDELTLLRCHQNAFEYFGGVPKKVLYDNMKTVVIERDKYGKGDHGFQKTFLDFSKHYGFNPKLCHPYRPQTKGKVERFGGYLKHSFYYPLIIKGEEELSLGRLNYEAKKWLTEVADPRRLREKKSTPKKLFEKEQKYLQPLPPPYLGMITRLEVESIEKHSLELYEKVGGCR